MKTVFVLICASLAAGCQSSSNPSSAPPPAVAPSGPATVASPLTANGAANGAANGPVTVSDALKLPADAPVQIRGLYVGWNGSCKGAPPTRSAWQLAESNVATAACIYVDGPSVPNVQPNAPPPDLAVTVRGKVVVDGPARYVKAESVETQ